jgi:uncharacterized protein with von Willebrand factor type A (vWA) domain
MADKPLMIGVKIKRARVEGASSSSDELSRVSARASAAKTRSGMGAAVAVVKQTAAMTSGKAYFATPGNLTQFALIDFLRRKKSRVK